ncbi:hypothetical protein J6590_063983 [Homalodisca vitripennis]|nr:hypothetical protein J6590_063983 [Homalodisca vitripennis]
MSLNVGKMARVCGVVTPEWQWPWSPESLAAAAAVDHLLATHSLTRRLSWSVIDRVVYIENT